MKFNLCKSVAVANEANRKWKKGDRKIYNKIHV